MLRLRAGARRALSPHARSSWSAWPAGPAISICTISSLTLPPTFRGEFKPIKTNVPGFDICELFPRQAAIADKLALVRTVQFVEPMQHELEEVYTGFPKSAKRPAFGSRHQPVPRALTAPVPSYVSLDKYHADHAEVENPRYRRGGPSAVPVRQRGRQATSALLKGVHAAARWPTGAHCRWPSTHFAAISTASGEPAAWTPFIGAGVRHDHVAESSRRLRPEPRAGQGATALRRARSDKYTYGQRPTPTNPWPAENSCWLGGWSRRVCRW